MFEPGQVIELNYPDVTLVEAIARFQRRRIRVHRIRDLVREPLTPQEYLRRTKLRRSRWLIYGYDLDRCAWRKFYLGSSAEYPSPETLRLAIYEPFGVKPVDVITREFGPTARERIILARVICRWLNKDLGDLQLRIVADDLRLIA
jgi:hypothetical protein